MGAPYPEAIRDWVLRAPLNAKDVFYLSDLPPTIGGVITLESGVIYRIKGTVSLAAGVRIDAQDAFILGEGSFTTAIIGNTAGPLITASGGAYAVISGMVVINTGAGAAVDLSATTGLASVSMQNSLIQSGGPAVIVRDAGFVLMIQMTVTGAKGLELMGTIGGLTAIGVQFQPVPGALGWIGVEVSAAANLGGASISGCVLELPEAANIGVSLSPLATYTMPVSLLGDVFGSVGTPIDPAGLQKSDKELVILQCAGQESSLYTGRASFQNNAAVTTFPDASYYPIGNGTPAHTLFVLNPLSERVTLTGATTQLQVLTCDAFESHTYMVQATLALFKAGLAATMSFGVRVNGTLVPSSVIATEVTATWRTLTISCMVTLDPGDTVQIVASNPSLSNVTVTSASLLVHRL